MEMKINIAEGLDLPMEAITQTFAHIGKRGAGKTYLASMIAEQMLDAEAQVIVLDPIGNWWGLRVDADGKSKGKDVYVMGGSHGDVPLSSESGREIAKILTEKNLSVVLDISEFRKNERKKFVTDFAEEFYHLKKARPSAVHIFLEESQKFVPQRVMRDDARMLGAWEDIVRLGRNYGIGCSLITQRPQSVNKEVLSQVECLCVLQITGLHERKALEGWIQEVGQKRDIVDELPGFTTGEGYVWSPSWLRIFKKVNFNTKTTLDTGATPELGKATKAAKLSKMDIVKLQEFMNEVIEKTQKDLKEVKDFKNEILRLNKQIRDLERHKVRPEIDHEKMDREIERVSVRERKLGWDMAEKEYLKNFKEIKNKFRKLETAFQSIIKIITSISNEEIEVNQTELPRKLPFHKTNLQTPTSSRIISKSVAPVTHVTHQSNSMKPPLPMEDDEENPLSICAKKIYSFLFANPGMEFTKNQVAFMTNYRMSGSFNNSMYSLTARKLAVKVGDKLSLGESEPELATESQEEFRKELFTRRLNKCSASIFEILWDNPYDEYTKQELVELTGYTLSGSFNNSLYRLTGLKFAIKTGDSIKINPEVLELK